MIVIFGTLTIFFRPGQLDNAQGFQNNDVVDTNR